MVSIPRYADAWQERLRAMMAIWTQDKAEFHGDSWTSTRSTVCLSR